MKESGATGYTDQELLAMIETTQPLPGNYPQWDDGIVRQLYRMAKRATVLERALAKANAALDAEYGPGHEVIPDDE